MLLKIALKSYVFQGNAPSEQLITSVTWCQEGRRKMCRSLSQFLMHPSCAPALRSPWCPLLDLLQNADICLMWGAQARMYSRPPAVASPVSKWGGNCFLWESHMQCRNSYALPYLSSSRALHMIFPFRTTEEVLNTLGLELY